MDRRTTEEDVWGLREYSLQNSVRLINHNPDMMNVNIVSCSCGETIDRTKDWHVMIANGTLICRSCARCSSCRLDSSSANGRLVCIDGLVLCHMCLQNFGHFVEPAFKIMIDDPNNHMEPKPENVANDNNVGHVDDSAKQADSSAEKPDTPAAKPDTPAVKPDNAAVKEKAPAVKESNNATNENENSTQQDACEEALQEYNRKDRSCYKAKVDNRRPIRKALYDPQSARLPDERNPLIKAPVYDALIGSLDQMSCPSCAKVARGPVRYVVPSMARVYHKACFSCHTCKTVLSSGMQLAGKHFEYCTCEPPLVWCTRGTCRKQRLEHHASTGKCWLGALRPGGRYQLDTDISAEAARQAAAAKERGEPKASGVGTH